MSSAFYLARSTSRAMGVFSCKQYTKGNVIAHPNDLLGLTLQHSCDANCTLQSNPPALVSSVDIEPHTELTLNYIMNKILKHAHCMNCRTVLTPFDQTCKHPFTPFLRSTETSGTSGPLTAQNHGVFLAFQ